MLSVDAFKKSIVFAILLLPTFCYAAVDPVTDPSFQRTEGVRSVLYKSDYLSEARRAVKTIQGANLRIRKLLERARNQNLVVLVNALEGTAASVDSLSLVAHDLEIRLREVVPRKEEPPTAREKEVGDQSLRQLVILKDRAMAIYGDSEVFFKKLSTETKDNVVTRLN